MVHINRLSAVAVGKLKIPGYYLDGAGLVLQVSATGTKSWIFRYTLAGRAREMGLGSARVVDLARARALAAACRELLQEGVDPLEARRERRATRAAELARRMTFDQCASAYIQAHRGTWRNPKHAAQWESTLRTYASPVIGALAVSDVDTDLVVTVLSPIWNSKTETATRLRGRIESILDWATVSKFRQGENPARWRGHLDNLLANPNKIAPVKNRPALPWRELPGFIEKLVKLDGAAARAVHFAILTAGRSGEVRGATWGEMDLGAKLWVVPGKRMKAGKEHRVPLSTAAVDLLSQSPAAEGVVFPGRDHITELSDMTLTAVLRRMGRGDITVHGFRSTFRDWCAEAPGNAFPREVCEHALAHSLPDRVEAAYQRGDLLAKRAVLMQAWADYCASTLAKPAEGGG